MANKGAYPLDPLSPVGQLRSAVGDTASTPLEPDEPGFASYAVWSDVALEAALNLAGGSVYRAAGDLYTALAAQYAQVGLDITTDDLRLNTSKRGSDFLLIAKNFYARADELEGGSDFFQIVPFGGRAGRTFSRPEATPWPVAPLPSLPSPALPVTPEPTGYGW
ncbi:hypothetical protein [Microbacterium sp. zg-YB36]|uniref:hypothetical protein n=1 Tax=Microbacterium sp. zg-YB36 TaxID=2969407 RepID=UPI00214B4A11|nr:hypothetical protein [Microbacterium sp. zg-YB36]MDL5351212.1 hypothetical protein [Microbacterium sp. zg-YB36]